MAVFFGIDLAWTAHHESGICVIEGDPCGLRVAALEAAVVTPGALASRISSAGPNVVAAIDAPLVVGPRRRAEAALARKFARYGAYAYTATQPFLERMGGLAGPRLASLLAARGVCLDPPRHGTRASAQFAIEMYPHAFQVVLFSLPRILLYKRGRLEQRREALDVYRACLAQVLDALPLVPSPHLHDLLWAPLENVRGGALKRIEDQLDAVTCALAAFEAWQHGLAPGEVFGDAEDGYIAVPGVSRDERFA